MQSTESSGEKEGINLRACCCASTPWTIAPHRATLVRVNALSGVAAVACRQPRQPGDLSPGHGQPTKRGWMGGACSPGKESPPPATCAGSSPWMPCPGCARSLAGGGESRLGEDGTGPLLAAFTFGEQGDQDAQWELFRGSGLTYIIAISGQHIALVAVLGWWLGRLFGLRGAICVSLLFAATYSWLAGFAVATERALIMVLVWSLLRWLKRDWPSHRIWLWAFVVPLDIVGPFRPHSAGFWLFSGGGPAVAGEPAARSPRPGAAATSAAARIAALQLLLFEGMAPGVSAQSAGTAAVLPCHHSLALIGVLVAPLHVAGPRPALSSAFGLGVGAVGLTQLADRLQLWWPVPGWLMPASALLILLWTGWHLPGGAHLGAGGGGPAARPLACTPASWQVRVLDVGQGLSVLVTGGIGPSCLIPGIATPGAGNLWRMWPSCPCSTGSASG